MKGVWASLVTAAMLAGSASLAAQEIASQPQTRSAVPEQTAFPSPIKDDCCAEVKQKMADLERQLNQLKQRVGKNDKDIVTLRNGLQEATSALKDAQQRLTDHESALKIHTDSLVTLGGDLSNLKQQFLQSSRFDPASNRYIPNILGNMQVSQSLRQEMGEATQGRIVLYNETPSAAYLYINGVRWRVLPGKSYVNVPRGLVIVQRQGYSEEKINTWRLDAQGYMVEYSLTYGPIVSPDYH